MDRRRGELDLLLKKKDSMVRFIVLRARREKDELNEGHVEV